MHSSYNWTYLIRISVATALGGYLFGFDFAVITGGLPFLRDHCVGGFLFIYFKLPETKGKSLESIEEEMKG